MIVPSNLHTASRLFLLFLLAAPASAELTVSGVVDDQVFQRNEKDRAAVAASGTCAAAAVKIQARVTRRGDALEGLDWRDAGTAKDGAWRATVEGLPVGGPYGVEFRAVDQGGATVESGAVRNILVGDLWVLGGQSNMTGNGKLLDVQPPDPRVHSFDQQDRWLLAEEPLHSLPDAVDPIHWTARATGGGTRLDGEALLRYRRERTDGTGPGLPFAVSIVERTGVPIGLVPCAHGGTSMEKWSPALKEKGGDSLYGAMCRRVAAVGGRVRGMLWYQGESDTKEPRATEYPEKLKAFVAALRRDFGAPELPFYYVQLSRDVSPDYPEWNKVQEAQRTMESEIPHAGMAAAVDLQLDDIIHIGSQGQKRLGRRLANLAILHDYPDAQAKLNLKRGPRPVSLKWEDVGKHLLRVTYSDVNGRLRPDGRIAGFSLRDAAGKEIRMIYDADVDPHAPDSVRLRLTGPDSDEAAPPPPGATLWYGWGTDPFCNLTDDADMAAPAFGPMPLP